MLEIIEAGYSQKGLKKALTDIFGFYPKQPIAPGGKWMRKVPCTFGTPLVMTGHYMLRNQANSILAIDFRGSFQEDPNDPPEIIQGHKFLLDTTGKGNGTILVDEKTGWLRSMKMAFDLKTVGKLETPNGEYTDVSDGASNGSYEIIWLNPPQ